jgi:hypothetical protein
VTALQRAIGIDRQVLGPQHPQTRAAERALSGAGPRPAR